MKESTDILNGELIGIKFALASHKEVDKASVNECPISHSSQLSNPFLGLPLETGNCESCGASEPKKCEGHFGYIELPVPVYHPSYVGELRKMLSFLCLNCLKLKDIKLSTKKSGGLEKSFSCCEVLAILKKLPKETKKKLAKKGYFPQEGYILRLLPVPPNCLSIPDISDGICVMSNDLASTMLKKVLKQIEILKSIRSDEQDFESHELKTNELQVAIAKYLQVRGAGTASNEAQKMYGVKEDASKTASKAWVEKMKTLFISKGSRSSSRSVIIGDAYRRVNEIGLPSDIAQKITFEEKVNMYNHQNALLRYISQPFRDHSTLIFVLPLRL